MHHQRRLYALCALILSACSPGGPREAAVPEPDGQTRRTLAQGVVVGTQGRDGAQAWYGIPFAQAPVGDLRWRAPRPAEGWSGVFEAVDFTRRCPQYAGDSDPDAEAGVLVGDEDCLYLNVWAPPGHRADDAPLPVMVWIHGGGNVTGWAGQYEMGRLAARGDVVVASFNYRLGPLGWFAHEAVRDTAETALDQTANFATLDSLRALEWVKDNIAAFGGDPQRVTIFGESAGAVNVAMLLTAPQAEGLFHRAIMQSGSFTTHSLEEAEYGPPPGAARRGHASREAIAYLADAQGLSLQEASSARLAGALRALPADAVLDAYRALHLRDSGPLAIGAYDSIDVTRDGVVIPLEGVEARLSSPDRFNAVPLILGTNRDELLGLGFFDEDMMNNIGPLAYWPDDWDFYEAYGEYPSRIWRAFAVDEPASELTRAGHSPVYAYRLDWDEQGRMLGTDLSRLIGASHTIDLPFVTGNFEDPISDPLGVFFNRSNRQGREALSAALMAYWSEFAATGRPGRGRDGALPLWPSWSDGSQAGRLQVLDTAEDGGLHTIRAPITVESVLNELEADPRLESETERCEIILKIQDLFPFLGDRIAPYEARNCGQYD